MDASELDLNWIIPNLALGGRIPEQFAPALADVHHIRRIIDVRCEDQDNAKVFLEYGIEVLHLPTVDRCALSQEHLWTGVTWAIDALKRSEKVLIHCEHGIGRSVLLSCCTLISLGHNPVDALKLMKSARQKVSPSPEQLHALVQWYQDWSNKNKHTSIALDWNDLAKIAYNL